MNPLERFRRRAELKAALREFFGARGGLEIDTPIVVPAPGTEAYLRYFPTAWKDARGKDRALFLRSSPELHMKQAMAEGARQVFQLAPCFRSGGELAAWHHPEFTMLEWYERDIGYGQFIGQTEALLRHSLDRMKAVARLRLPTPVPRLTVAEAFHQFAGIRLVDGDPDLAKQAKSLGCPSVRGNEDFETAFFKVLLDKVEPGIKALGSAVLMDYPPSQAALAIVENGVARRFEFYVNGVELSNGFQELLDPATNRRRIEDANAKRRALGFEVPGADPAFHAALAKGLPPCCGNALGFDRWLALILGEASLDAVVPFREAKIYEQ